MGENECDDGNTKSGDGCSSSCVVETNYACSGGNETTADTCVNRKPPEMQVLRYYGNRTAVLTFTAAVRFLASLDKLVSFTINGGEASCVGWTYVQPKKIYTRTLTFYLSYNYSLSGSEASSDPCNFCASRRWYSRSQTYRKCRTRMGTR